MISRSRKVMTRGPPVNQPVTSRQCIIPYCEKSEQLVNVCCKNCEDKKFSQKHYMCMSCYINVLRHAYENSVPPTCPLDRSELTVEPLLTKLIQCDNLLDDFWKTMNTAAAQFAHVRDPHATPRTLGERRTVRRVRRHEIITHSPPGTPPGVAQERAFIERQRNEIPVRFPNWTDDEGNMYQTGWPNATTTHIAVASVQNLINNAEIMQSMIDNQENIPPRDLDDEAANGFHDPNA